MKYRSLTGAIQLALSNYSHLQPVRPVPVPALGDDDIFFHQLGKHRPRSGRAHPQKLRDFCGFSFGMVRQILNDRILLPLTDTLVVDFYRLFFVFIACF